MTLTPRTDYVAQAQARLPRFFRDKPRLFAVLAAMAESVQDLEANAFTLYTPRFLANAVGPTLDIYGGLVGQERFGMDDASYRLRIGARMALNRSSGTEPDLIAIADLLVGDDNTLLLTESYPAGVSLQVAGVATALEADVYAMLYAAKAGGVSFRFVTQDGPDAERFVFTGGVGLGFGGYGTDALGTRVDVVPTGIGPPTVGTVLKTGAGIGPPTLGPVTTVEGPGTTSPPNPSLTGGPVLPLLGTITISMIDDVDFTWTGAGSYGGAQNIGDGGGPGLPFELVDATLGGIGINIAFVEDETYLASDGWSFTVTPGTSTATDNPTVAVVAEANPGGIGEVTLTVTSIAGAGTFTWASSSGAGNATGQPMYVSDGLGGFLPVELDDTVGATGLVGLTVLFGAGEPYLVDDAWTFTVTAGTQTTSTPPTVAATGALAVTGKVTLEVTTGLGGYEFRYQRPDGTTSSVASMTRGTPVALLNADASPMGLSVTWPNVASIYTGAKHAWRAYEADATVGGRWVRVR